MKLSQMADQVERDSITIEFEFEEGTKEFELEPLTKLEWANIQKELNKDVWRKVLEVSADLREASDEERGQAMVSLMGELDEEVQVEMWYQKLKKKDPDIDRGQVDNIITYAIKDQEQYFRGLFYMFQGVDVQEAREELEDTGGSGNQNEASEEEQSTGTG